MGRKVAKREDYMLDALAMKRVADALDIDDDIPRKMRDELAADIRKCVRRVLDIDDMKKRKIAVSG